MPQRPLIGLVCDVKQIGKWDYHAVGDKYIRAVQQAVGNVILLPSLADPAPLRRLLPLLDGIFLPGSYTNIEPKHYGEGVDRAGTLHDAARDETVFPLIHMALDTGIPLLGVCRGLQEINVALGGSLYRHVQELPGKLDHRETNGDIAEQYADAHDINICPNSLLRQWFGGTAARVNSLHQQGIRTLAQGLSAEAFAPDGLIEAFRINAAPWFGYAVQWHPEWQYNQNPLSVAIFSAFRQACVAYLQQKSRTNPFSNP